MRRFLAILLLLAAPLWAQQKEGGIIGTGVLGQITALGSITVGGHHIRFAPDMAYEDAAPGTLAPGMVVAATVVPDGDDWLATHLRRVSALIGPVTAPGEVMGVPVAGDLPESGWVRVDGFWSDVGLVATHVAPAPSGRASVTGRYAGGQVGPLRFGGITPAHLAEGDLITIDGRYDGQLIAERLQKGLFLGDTPALVLAEGYLSPPTPSGLYELIGAGISAYTDQPSMIQPDQQVTLCSLNGRSDFDAEALPETLRAEVLRLCGPRP